MALPRKRSKEWYRDRRTRVRHALGLRSMTLAEYAASLDVSHTHLNFVLRGTRTSARIDYHVSHLLAWAYGPHIGAHYS